MWFYIVYREPIITFSIFFTIDTSPTQLIDYKG